MINTMKLLKLLKRQVQREFFGTLGFISGTAILSYGVFFPRAVKLAPASVSDFNAFFTIPLAGIGAILIVMTFIYMIAKNYKGRTR